MASAQTAIADLVRRFAQAGLDSPRLNAELLLARALGVTRGELMGLSTRELSTEEAAGFDSLARRRLAHEPIDYILGEREFYGRTFRLRRGVLIPRPETETIIDVAMRECAGLAGWVADIGCGSGPLAVTLALEFPRVRVIATDISTVALAVARENAAALSVTDRMFCARMDGLSAARRGFDLIVSNPPYVDPATADSLQPEVRDFEPPEALFGGKDGLEVAARLLAQAAERLKPGALCLFEHAFNQGAQMRELARWAGLQDVRTINDMSGLERVLFARG